eukprot:447098_1
MHELHKYWEYHWTQQNTNTLSSSLQKYNFPQQLILIIKEYANTIPEGPSSIIISRKYEKINFEELRKQHLDDIHHLQELKLAVFGKTQSGKSAIVLRKVIDNFLGDDYESGLEDSYRKRIQYDNNALLFDILDTMDIFNSKITDIDHYNKIVSETRMAMIVFDLSDYESWNWIKKHNLMNILNKEKTGKKYPVVLVGSKCDLVQREVPPKEIMEFIVRYNAPYIECSAKQKINVEKLFYSAYQEGYTQLMCGNVD